jgi:hypothetical protein
VITIAPTEANRNPAAVAVELHRVVNQVSQHLDQPMRIGKDFGF